MNRPQWPPFFPLILNSLKDEPAATAPPFFPLILNLLKDEPAAMEKQRLGRRQAADGVAEVAGGDAQIQNVHPTIAIGIAKGQSQFREG